MIATLLLCAAIKLAGVTGSELTARAYFDVNNCKVGDPLVLTIDFLGAAEFRELHPPALSKAVNRKDWRVDDASAKTETDTRRVGGFFSSREVAVARSLTYRVRPLHEGVLWFPALEFEYEGEDGSPRTIVANEIPVHARPGEQVNVDERFADCVEAADKFPEPPELQTDPAVTLTDDERFAWLKACAHPSAAAFAEFAFPVARMNEATCAIRDGQWSRAMKIYARLEWEVGQTPAIEQGMLAALAVRMQSAQVELPIWRQVGRPVLRYGWLGRIALTLGGIVALAIVFFLLGRLVRLFACLAFGLLLVPTAQAQFQILHSGFDAPSEPVTVTATVTTDSPSLQVGQVFHFLLSVEAPKTVTLGQLQLQPSEMYGLTLAGQVENLTDAQSANPSNVIKRLSVPVRYDVPLKGPLTFTVSGSATGRVEKRTRNGFFSSSFSRPFECRTPVIQLEVKPLSTQGQPPDFSGIIAEDLKLTERTDLRTVETNDVIQIVYHLEYRGYLPQDWRPEGVAFEIGRGSTRSGVNIVEWQRYFVADGARTTPRFSFSYYDPGKKAYRKLSVGGTHVNYQ